MLTCTHRGHTFLLINAESITMYENKLKAKIIWLQSVKMSAQPMQICVRVCVFYDNESSDCIPETTPQCLCSADSLQENRAERVLLDIYTQQPYHLAIMMVLSWPQKTALSPEKAHMRQTEK